MSIKIEGLIFQENNGKYAPFFECTICQKPIQEKGMVFHNGERGVTAHHECMSKVTDNKKIYPMAEELKNFLFNLLHNSKIKPEQFPIEF